MFIASKILAFLTEPLAWVALLVAAGLLSVNRRPRLCKGLLTSSLLILLLLGWTPLSNAVLRPLETRFAPVLPDADLRLYTGVVILGGALESSYLWTLPGQYMLNSAAERMTNVATLLRSQPKLQLVFTGGEGELLASGLSEAQRAQIFFASQGITERQVRYESASRNTYENAVFSKALPEVDPTQRWLLLTSAWHMPRAMATFQKTGWNVTAYPTDFRTAPNVPWTQYSMKNSLSIWRTALHEWLGLLAYRVSGRA